MMKLFGIPNCDTVKKARDFLTKKKVSFDFVDLKKTPPTKDDILRWQKAFGDLPVNVKGQTYKKYQSEYEGMTQEAKVAFLIKNSSMIKRPILEQKNDVLAFGFNEELYAQKLSHLK